MFQTIHHRLFYYLQQIPRIFQPIQIFYSFKMSFQYQFRKKNENPTKNRIKRAKIALLFRQIATSNGNISEMTFLHQDHIIIRKGDAAAKITTMITIMTVINIHHRLTRFLQGLKATGGSQNGTQETMGVPQVEIGPQFKEEGTMDTSRWENSEEGSLLRLRWVEDQEKEMEDSFNRHRVLIHHHATVSRTRGSTKMQGTSGVDHRHRLEEVLEKETREKEVEQAINIEMKEKEEGKTIKKDKVIKVAMQKKEED